MAPPASLKARPARLKSSTPISLSSRRISKVASSAPTSPTSVPTKRKASQVASEPPATPAKRKKVQQYAVEKESIIPEDEDAQDNQYTGQLSQQSSEQDDVPFLIECPTRLNKKYNPRDDAFRRTDDGDIPLLSVDYTIRPGTLWGGMNAYKRVKLHDLDFKRGDFAYFARKLSPPEETTDDEIIQSKDPLAFERENMWIGMIGEARARKGDGKNVYLRIMYAYWPEELPQGRQPYHGVKEVIMSNHMDILDAHTITGKVDIQHINDDRDEIPGGLYWRQILDVRDKEKGMRAPGVLSPLDEKCRCRTPYCPDEPMFICRANGGSCGLWNHEQCLIEDVLGEAWHKYQEGTLRECDDEEAEPVVVKAKPETSPFRRIATTVVSMVPGLRAKTNSAALLTPEVESETDEKKFAKPNGRKSGKDNIKAKTWRDVKKRKAGEAAPWEGTFNATIDATGKWGPDGLVMAQVMDSDSTVVWTTAVSCLACEQKLE